MCDFLLSYDLVGYRASKVGTRPRPLAPRRGLIEYILYSARVDGVTPRQEFLLTAAVKGERKLG